MTINLSINPQNKKELVLTCTSDGEKEFKQVYRRLFPYAKAGGHNAVLLLSDLHNRAKCVHIPENDMPFAFEVFQHTIALTPEEMSELLSLAVTSLQRVSEYFSDINIKSTVNDALVWKLHQQEKSVAEKGK